MSKATEAMLQEKGMVIDKSYDAVNERDFYTLTHTDSSSHVVLLDMKLLNQCVNSLEEFIKERDNGS